MNTNTITIITALFIVAFLAFYLTRKFHKKKNVDTVVEEIDNGVLMPCPNCFGTGGCYENSADTGEAEFVKCERCQGRGRIADKRSREQKLDDWENESRELIVCQFCAGRGIKYQRANSTLIRQACDYCNGYGKIWDARTPEQKAEEKRAAEEALASERIRRMAQEDALGLHDYDNCEVPYVGKLDEYAKKVCQLEDKIAQLEKRDLVEITDKARNIEEKCNSMAKTLDDVAKEVGYLISIIGFITIALGIGTCSDDKNNEPKVTLKDVNSTVQSIEHTVDKIEQRIDKIEDEIAP